MAECHLRTVVDDESIDAMTMFQHSPVRGTLVVYSDLLREALSDILDLPGAGSLTISWADEVRCVPLRFVVLHRAESSSSVHALVHSPSSQPFRCRFTTQGTTGSCHVDVHPNSARLVSFSCAEPVEQTYQLSLLQEAMRGLTAAPEMTTLRVNEQGILSVLHKFEQEGKLSYVSFTVLPNQAEELEDEVALAAVEERARRTTGTPGTPPYRGPSRVAPSDSDDEDNDGEVDSLFASGSTAEDGVTASWDRTESPRTRRAIPNRTGKRTREERRARTTRSPARPLKESTSGVRKFRKRAGMELSLSAEDDTAAAGSEDANETSMGPHRERRRQGAPRLSRRKRSP